MKINIKESSNVNLSDLELLKSEYADNQYFVAIKYINLPFIKKIRLKPKDITSIPKETNSYLIHTPLLKELKKEFGFFPKVQIDKDNLIIKNQSFKINSDTLKKLFS